MAGFSCKLWHTEEEEQLHAAGSSVAMDSKPGPFPSSATNFLWDLYQLS